MKGVFVMKKWHMVAIAALLILLAAVLFILYKQNEGTMMIEVVRSEIDRANYCTTNSDCVDIGPQCPYGCGIFVNKNERQRIQDRINAIPLTWDCFYKCQTKTAPVCLEGKCQYANRS